MVIERFQAFRTLADAIVNIIPVLESFTPDHVHWPLINQPWFFQYLQKGHFNPNLVDSLHNIYLDRKGMDGTYYREQEIYFAKEDSRWPVKQVLKFNMVDFRFSNDTGINIYINTTRVKDNFYQLNIPILGMPYNISRGGIFEIPENQPLIQSLILARV